MVGIEKIEKLHQQLNEAIEKAANDGDITTAREIQNQLQTEMSEIRARLDPYFGLHPELKKIIEKEKVPILNITIGGKKTDELIRKLKQKDRYISGYAEDVMLGVDFMTLALPKQIQLICLPMEKGMFKYQPNLKQIFDLGFKWGLGLCPVETGPQLRLQYDAQSSYDLINIAMMPIRDSEGYGSIFRLGHTGHEFWIDGFGAKLNSQPNLNSKFVFLIPQLI